MWARSIQSLKGRSVGFCVFSFVAVPSRFCSDNKSSTTVKEFTSQNWTKERQKACVDSILQNKKELEEKWKATEEIAGEDPEQVEDVRVHPDTGEVGGPKGPEPTRYGDWERKGRVSDF